MVQFDPDRLRSLRSTEARAYYARRRDLNDKRHSGREAASTSIWLWSNVLEGVSPVYLYMWEFDVPAGGEAEFERLYGPRGAWAKLFRRAPGYRSTRLFRETGQVPRYVTLDEWESKTHCEAFRREFEEEYEALDRRCERLTLAERPRISVDAEEVG